MSNTRKIALFDILSKNGFSFTSKDIDAFDARLEQEGFEMDETGSFWSPGGQSLVDAVYRGWSDSEPATAPTKPATQDAQKPDPYHGYSQAEWQAMSPERRYSEADKGPATPSWMKSVPILNDAQCAAFAGLSLADFKALSVERRLEIEATAKGALMKGGAQ